jgi:hypothetical protein
LRSKYQNGLPTLSSGPNRYHRMAAESHPYRRLHLFETSTATQARAPQQDEDEEGDFEDIGVVAILEEGASNRPLRRPRYVSGASVR